VEEGKPVAHQLCGDRLLLKRIDGKVYAIRDRCLHRGVQLSRKPECYTKNTITCWYHGWTYRFDTGELCDIVTDPQSSIIGKRRTRTFPVTEAKGLVFVFMGEMDPPPLAHDVPPGFLDDDLAVRAVRKHVKANWRIGCENGFDSTHVFIHKRSILIEGNDLILPLGFVPSTDRAFKVEENDDGPCGVYDLLAEHSKPVFEGKIGGDKVLNGHMGTTRVANNISIWLPCVLRVQPWPDPTLTQYEWYVPEGPDTHWYVQTLGRSVTNEADRRAFDREFDEKWRDMALAGFNDDDIWAREATQEFYGSDWGWIDEQLFEPDQNIIEWRKLASRRNRGIQRLEDLRR
jgi:carbazole 1,9a-dioxygenase terminal dioxygenase component